eukprot:g56477.t1
MASLPLVSIIIPVYNSAAWLGEMFQSVLAQSYQGPLEVSIFDDGSTDGSLAELLLWRPRLQGKGIKVQIGRNTAAAKTPSPLSHPSSFQSSYFSSFLGDSAPTQIKGATAATLRCEPCRSQFPSQVRLQHHLASSKHKRQVAQQQHIHSDGDHSTLSKRALKRKRKQELQRESKLQKTQHADAAEDVPCSAASTISSASPTSVPSSPSTSSSLSASLSASLTESSPALSDRPSPASTSLSAPLNSASAASASAAPSTRPATHGPSISALPNSVSATDSLASLSAPPSSVSTTHDSSSFPAPPSPVSTTNSSSSPAQPESNMPASARAGSCSSAAAASCSLGSSTVPAACPPAVVDYFTPGPGGPGFARNQAIAHATAEWLCLLDSDDVLHPQRIELQMAYMLSLCGAVSASAGQPVEPAARPAEPAAQVGAEGRRTIVGSNFVRTPPNSTPRYTDWLNSLTDEQVLLHQYREVSMIQPTWLFHRDVFNTVGGYDQSGPGAPEDLIFFYEHLQKGGKLHKIPQPLVTYRYVEGSYCSGVHRVLLLKLRVQHLQQSLLSKDPRWARFSIWGAGRDGRRVFSELSQEFSDRVVQFLDVDPKKVGTFYVDQRNNRKVPIIHFSDFQGAHPLLLCVATARDGRFEQNLSSLNLREGVDYIHFG